MAVSLVPEHLRKPELVFEVTSRGQEAEDEVKLLRTQLRACISVQRSWQDSFDLNGETTACKTRLEELDDDLDSGSLCLAGSARARLGSQLIHWHARVELLASAPGVTSEVREWAQNAGQKLKAALEDLNGIFSVKQRGSIFQGPPLKGVSLLTLGQQGANAGENSALSSANLENGPPSSTHSARLAPATLSGPPVFPVLMTNQCSGAESGRGNESLGQPFSNFSKLPHPLSATLQNIPYVDGLDVNALLAFLEEIFRIRDFPGMTDAALLEILAPFCLKPLSDRLFDCLRRGVSFDIFHAEVIEYFIPARVMERLRVERVYRPQAPAETLSRFVGDIRGVARVLRLGFSERQLVDLILEGVKPEERSRLVFCARPSSFADLDRLSIFSRGVQDADLQREAMMRHLPHTPSRPTFPPVQSGRSEQNPRGQAPSCFGCGQRGHVRRDCPQAFRGSNESKN